MKSFSMYSVLEFVTVNKNLKTWIKLMNSSRHCALYLRLGWTPLLSIAKFHHHFSSLHLWWFKLPNREVISISWKLSLFVSNPKQFQSKFWIFIYYELLFWRKKVLTLTPNSVSSFSNLTLYFCTVSRNLCICTYVLHKRALSQ